MQEPTWGKLHYLKYKKKRITTQAYG